jgi:hypothetical protein
MIIPAMLCLLQGFEETEIPAGRLVVCYVYGENGAEEHFAMDVYKDSLKAWKEAGFSVYKSNCSTVTFKSSLSCTK